MEICNRVRKQQTNFLQSGLKSCWRDTWAASATALDVSHQSVLFAEQHCLLFQWSRSDGICIAIRVLYNCLVAMILVRLWGGRCLADCRIWRSRYQHKKRGRKKIARDLRMNHRNDDPDFTALPTVVIQTHIFCFLRNFDRTTFKAFLAISVLMHFIIHQFHKPGWGRAASKPYPAAFAVS